VVTCDRDATELPPCLHPGLHPRSSVTQSLGRTAVEWTVTRRSRERHIGRRCPCLSCDMQKVGTAMSSLRRCWASTTVQAVNNVRPRLRRYYRKSPSAQGHLRLNRRQQDQDSRSAGGADVNPSHPTSGQMPENLLELSSARGDSSRVVESVSNSSHLACTSQTYLSGHCGRG